MVDSGSYDQRVDAWVRSAGYGHRRQRRPSGPPALSHKPEQIFTARGKAVKI